MIDEKQQKCVHKNESLVWITDQQRYCPKCGKIYYYDPVPIDWKKNSEATLNYYNKINTYKS